MKPDSFQILIGVDHIEKKKCSAEQHGFLSGF